MDKAHLTTVKFLAAGAMALACTVASAQWAVIDPTNLVQNLLSAKAAVKTEITTTLQLKHDIEQAIQLAKSTKQIGDLKGIARFEAALKMHDELRGVDKRLEVILDRAHDLGSNLKARVGASDGSWDKYLKSRDSIAVSQREATLAQFQAVNASLEDTNQRRKQIIERLGTVEGQTEAMQSLGALFDVVIGQNQQLITTMAQSNLARQAETDISRAESDQQSHSLDEYQKKLRAAARKY